MPFNQLPLFIIYFSLSSVFLWLCVQSKMPALRSPQGEEGNYMKQTQFPKSQE